MTLSKKSLLIIVPLVVFTLVASFSVVKKVSPLGAFWWGSVNTENNIAVHGYDPVSYFSAAPVKGKLAHSFSYKEITYYFSTNKNLELFKQSPDNFIPQFGNFCAFATSKGFTADTDPQAWTIIDNKLYFFADSGVKKQWLDGLSSNTKESSHRNWSEATL